MATRQKAVLEASAGSDGLAKLRRQYGCGPVKFSGTDNALYERHLLFDDVVNPAAAGSRERFEALARSVLLSDDEVDKLRDGVYSELLATMQRDPGVVPAAVDLIFVARNLERIGDHATNIAEDVVFLVKGVDVRHHAEQPESA